MRRMTSLAAALVLAAVAPTLAQDITRYVRYEHGGNVSYGVLEGETIHELRGDVFDSAPRTGDTVALADVRLLSPTAPKKVIAIGFNYRSHLGEMPEASEPGVFAKYPTSRRAPPTPRSPTTPTRPTSTTRGRWSSSSEKTAKSVPVEEANDLHLRRRPRQRRE